MYSGKRLGPFYESDLYRSTAYDKNSYVVENNSNKWAVLCTVVRLSLIHI